jgi:hypothetical protein
MYQEGNSNARQRGLDVSGTLADVFIISVHKTTLDDAAPCTPPMADGEEQEAQF